MHLENIRVFDQGLCGRFFFLNKCTNVGVMDVEDLPSSNGWTYWAGLVHVLCSPSSDSRDRNQVISACYDLIKDI